MRITFAVHPTGHTQEVCLGRRYLWAFARYKRGPYTAFSQFYTGVKSVTLGNYPLLLTHIKQETQADGMYVENIFSSKPVMYPHPTDTSAVFAP